MESTAAVVEEEEDEAGETRAYKLLQLLAQQNAKILKRLDTLEESVARSGAKVDQALNFDDFCRELRSAQRRQAPEAARADDELLCEAEEEERSEWTRDLLTQWCCCWWCGLL